MLASVMHITNSITKNVNKFSWDFGKR